MTTLTLDNFKMFNTFGLKEICSINRDIFSSYNFLLKDDLREYIKRKITENHDIIISSYILKDERFFFLKYRHV